MVGEMVSISMGGLSSVVVDVLLFEGSVGVVSISGIRGVSELLVRFARRLSVHVISSVIIGVLSGSIVIFDSFSVSVLMSEKSTSSSLFFGLSSVLADVISVISSFGVMGIIRSEPSSASFFGVSIFITRSSVPSI